MTRCIVFEPPASSASALLDSTDLGSLKECPHPYKVKITGHSGLSTLKYPFSYNHWSQAMLSLVSAGMKDSCSRTDLVLMLTWNWKSKCRASLGHLSGLINFCPGVWDVKLVIVNTCGPLLPPEFWGDQKEGLSKFDIFYIFPGLDPYSEQFADTKLWLQNGWVDFMAPQIYWEIEPPEQSYPAVLDWWLSPEVNPKDRYVCASNAVYKWECYKLGY